MARIVVCGAGASGLTTALLLAGDGHEVAVIERDPMEAPAPSHAWDAWERRGVNQFRLPHLLLPRWRHEMDAALPQVSADLRATGAYCSSFMGPFREMVPDPERFDVVTARRPVLDAVLAACAGDCPNVTIRRGVALAGLHVGTSAAPGIPHVIGVVTELGEAIPADLVVLATGRRSPFGRWLADIGSRPPHEEIEDSGFVYYGRHFRSRDGSPLDKTIGMKDYGSVSLLGLPADNGTAGVGIVGTSSDRALLPLRQEPVWERALAALPDGDYFLGAEPISPLVFMGGLEDRYRRFVVDDQPVVTGAVAVGDAWAATNPSLGRGISFATMHCLLLHDAIRDHLEDPYQLALAFDGATETTLTPWYRATLWHDRHKLADVQAEVTDGTTDTVSSRQEDEGWTTFKQLNQLALSDLDLATRMLASGSWFAETPQQLLADPDLTAKAAGHELGCGHLGPSRSELLDLISG